MSSTIEKEGRDLHFISCYMEGNGKYGVRLYRKICRTVIS